MRTLLEIDNLTITINEREIVQSLSLSVQPGTVHAIMGPNGSGKSTLASTLMGHPRYTITAGDVRFASKAEPTRMESILELAPDARAKAGMFLAFQYPYEVEGVRLYDFLRSSYNALWGGTDRQLGPKAFRELVNEKMALLGLSSEFAERSLNVGFSGGEKKRAEMLQLAVLGPRIAILDEIDSGLDIDALKAVTDGLRVLRAAHPEMSLLIITHYQRMLQYITPDYVHIMAAGSLVRSGGADLAHQLERDGYDMLIKQSQPSGELHVS